MGDDMDKVKEVDNGFNHGITLVERKNIVISGVKKIESFDSEEFLMETTLGYLVIKGNELEIIKLDTYQGNVSIKGKIDSMVYLDSNNKKDNDNSLLNTNILSLCDGIIFQGGSDIYRYHFQILNYAINNNIPVLGICMGHQIIGLYSQNTTNDKALIKIPNHNNKEKTHDIKIKPNTILYKIFGPTLIVNSRHNEALSKVNYPFKVSAVSKDNVIEGIEYVDDNHFVLGVQFHPEDLDNTENLYNYFLKEVLKRKK